MPSSTGRLILCKNLRRAQHQGDDSQAQHRGYDRENSDFNDNGVNSSVNDGGRENVDRRGSFASANSLDEVTRPTPLRHSSSLIDALSDSNSEIAHFLLASRSNEGDGNNGLSDNSFMKSFRNMATQFATGEDKVHEVGSLGTNKAWFYSLALEPMEVRRDRIIMLAEAYAIFGALFLSGTWVLYEWGSSYGYGGCKYEETSFCHPAVDRAFEAVMAMAITANIFQAMFASFLWLMSILFSGSHRNWVYGARYLLLLCHILLICVLVLTVASVGLGIYAKLTPYWPELAISMSFMLTIATYGMWATSNLAAEEISLEYYHFPLWFKWGLLPFPMLRRGGRQKIRDAAEKRAKELLRRAYKERSMLIPKSSSSVSRRASGNSVYALLRRAADSIGRFDFNVSDYEQCLEDDWYNDSEEMRNMCVDTLSNYMPRRLAEEVHNQLATDPVSVHTSSLGSGVFGGDGRERQVSWNLHEDSD